MSAFTVTVKAGIKKEKRKEHKDVEVPKPPSRIARQLALAYLVERLIDEGQISNYTDAARRLGVTRGRMTQVMNLMLLPFAVQEEILAGKSNITERQLRSRLGRDDRLC